uniref:U6 small nuclear RNA (adenine-(43)-N(6))-methyltransferase n=1 Tax=Graphocephala atropunctata TaxID=36148 RepID=A0A1B6KEI6_9HEMI
MSLNKFMHPRNKYRRPPDFKALAIKYPEFRKHAKQDISGKVAIDFKNLESLRALTSTLLKEDFDLDVEIPLNRLIPTLPLRLNYLLWIEDILAANSKTSSDIRGVDIGCGASCVYPLLAAKHFQWHMLGTEVDPESVLIASNNVKRNNLCDKITVRVVPKGTMLEGALETGSVYDFCLCNPPFFSSTEELVPQNVCRSPSRPPPRNALSGATWELVAPGGEVAFVDSIIQDSLKLREAVRVYSVMLGHKTSVGKVQAALKEAGVERVTSHSFCQGHTTRWGVAWTLDQSVVLAVNQQPSHKPGHPFSHTCDLDLQQTVEKLQQLMGELQITYSALKSNQNLYGMEITAVTNTWSNLRRKKRQEKRNKSKEDHLEVKPGDKAVEDQAVCQNESKRNESEKIVIADVMSSENDAEEIVNGNVILKSENSNDEKNIDIVKDGEISNCRIENKRTCDEDSGCSNNLKRPKMENSPEASKCQLKKVPVFVGSLIVKKGSQGTVIELSWIRGLGGRDSAHQVLQYFKNNLKPH